MIALLLIIAIAFAITIATTAIAIVDAVAFDAAGIAAIATCVAIVAIVVVIFIKLRNIAKHNKRALQMYKLSEVETNTVYILPNGRLTCYSLFLEYCQTYGDLAMCFNEEIRDKYQEECLSIGVNIRPYVSKARDLDLWEKIVLIGS